MSRTKFVPVTPELVPNLLKTVELLIQTHMNESNYEIFKGVGPNQAKRVNVAKDYSIAVKKCIVSHRFLPAAELLDIVCQQPTMDPIAFFKAASIILENNSLTNEDDFFKFTCHVHGLKDVSKYEIVLEYLIHSICKKDLEGYNTLESVVFGQRLNAAKNFIVDPLLKAYVGLLQYLKWSKNKDISEHDTTDTNAESSVKVIAAFKEAVSNPGQWDIFVLKLIEMLESSQRWEEIEEVLNKYVSINPEHINGLIYLCDYFHKHQYSSEKHFQSLKELSKRCPSDPRVVIFAELMISKNQKKAVNVLFTFLDYPCNSKYLKAWKLLSELLIGDFENVAELLKTLWLVEQRSHTWKYIHFPTFALNIDTKAEAKVVFHKALALCVLEKSSHPFVLAVLKSLSSISQSMFHKLEKKILCINTIKDNWNKEIIS